MMAQGPKIEPTPTPPAEDRLPPPPSEQATTPPAPTIDGPAGPISSDPALAGLPEPVRRMREQIVEAAKTGDVERMKPVLEMSELKPMTGAGAGENPIDYWKKASADGAGREILAAMLNVLEADFARVEKGGGQPMYIWPSLSERPLGEMTPIEEVELYRIAPADKVAAMKQAGRYQSYRAGIGADGTWHFFTPAK